MNPIAAFQEAVKVMNFHNEDYESEVRINYPFVEIER